MEGRDEKGPLPEDCTLKNFFKDKENIKTTQKSQRRHLFCIINLPTNTKIKRLLKTLHRKGSR